MPISVAGMINPYIFIPKIRNENIRVNYFSDTNWHGAHVHGQDAAPPFDLYEAKRLEPTPPPTPERPRAAGDIAA